MIPKIIHYCWFGNKMPLKIKKRIKKWKAQLPNYKFVEWNESNINITNCDFVREAYQKKKWAFVSDFARLYALYTMGGIYLDTDVKILKNFDEYMNEKFFISHESENSFCTAVIGSEKENDLVKDFLNSYYEKKFDIDGKLNLTPNSILIKEFIEKKFTSIKFDEEFINEKIHIFPRTYFCGKDIYNYKSLVTKNTITIHELDASWYGFGHKILKSIKKYLLKIVNLFR